MQAFQILFLRHPGVKPSAVGALFQKEEREVGVRGVPPSRCINAYDNECTLQHRKRLIGGACTGLIIIISRIIRLQSLGEDVVPCMGKIWSGENSGVS